MSGNIGTGIVLARNPTDPYQWSPPAAVGLSGLGWGLLAGISRKTIIYLIYDYFTLESLTGSSNDHHGAKLSAQITTSLGSWGRSAEAAAILHAKGVMRNIALVCNNQGIFGGVSIEGAICKGRNRVNERFYGQAGLSTRDILFSGEPLPIPDGTLLPDLYSKLNKLCTGTAIYEPTYEERARVKSIRKVVNREGEEAIKDEKVEFVDVPFEEFCVKEEFASEEFSSGDSSLGLDDAVDDTLNKGTSSDVVVVVGDHPSLSKSDKITD
jgi:hypothetical protein